MTLEQYTNLNRDDAFIYWLEFRTRDLGSIRGGDAIKFGIYRHDKDAKPPAAGRIRSAEYTWDSKYGESERVAFETVRSRLIEVIDAAGRGDLAALDDVDVCWPFVKWKVAFLYQDRETPRLLAINKEDRLAARYKEAYPTGEKAPPSRQHAALIEHYSWLGDALDISPRIWLDPKDEPAPEPDGRRYWLMRLGRDGDLWPACYESGVASIGYDDYNVGDLRQYESLDAITQAILPNAQRWPQNDRLALWNFCREVAPGDIVFVSKTLRLVAGHGAVSSRYRYDPTRQKHRHLLDVVWKSNFPDGRPVHGKRLSRKTLTEVTDPKRIAALKTAVESRGEPPPPEDEPPPSRYRGPGNPILYGPPGTGKTYSARRFARDIVDGTPALAKEKARILPTDPEERETTPNASGPPLPERDQVIARLYRNTEGRYWANLAPKKHGIPSRELGPDARFNHDRGWANMDGATFRARLLNWLDREVPPRDSTPKATRDDDCEAHIGNDLFNGPGAGSTEPDDQIAMVTFHQNYAYEDFVEGIRPKLTAPADRDGDASDAEAEETSPSAELGYELRPGIFKEICKTAEEERQAAEEEGQEPERFVLIIDEINRGNIPKIFGELITLIEDSRRLGGDDATTVTLPYSGDEFGVPSNLYIIGTMNTADRSIQQLDTALRRRFTFVEMMPDPDHELIPEDVDGVNCREMLRAMNERIAVLLDREHQIGHTYLFNVKDLDDLANRFRNRVFPLLQEYFYDDWRKIRAVLGGNAFVKERKVGVGHTRDLTREFDLVDDQMVIHERLPVGDSAWEDAGQYRMIYEPVAAD